MKVTFFGGPLLQKCRLETTTLCLNTRSLVNQNFPNYHYFIEINVNVCLLCANHVMTSIILPTQNLTVNRSLLRTCFLRFSWFSFFSFWGT